MRIEIRTARWAVDEAEEEMVHVLSELSCDVIPCCAVEDPPLQE